jgi:amino acid adenylation domain-containing protein
LSAQEREILGFRLSPQQQRLLEPDDGGEVVQCAAALRTRIGETELERALHAVTERHEILRTTFPRLAGLRGRSQLIHDSAAFEWVVRSAPAPGDQARLADILVGEAHRPFDLDRGPLGRALLIRSEQESGVLVLTVHAACADASSALSLLREVLDGTGAEPQEPVQYADYAQWRHELITGEDEPAAEGRAFWTAQTEDLPAAAAILFAQASPAGGGEERQPQVSFESIPVAVDSEQLARAAERAGVSSTLFVEAAWHASLARICAASELMLAGWCDGRVQPDLEGAVGPYSQPAPIRSRIGENTSFAEVLDQVGRERAQAGSWQDYASAEDLRAVTGAAAAGFAHVELAPVPEAALEVTAVSAPGSVSPLLWVRSGLDSLSVELWYDRHTHPGGDSAQLAAAFRTLLESAAEDPACPVARLRLSDPAEYEQLLALTLGPPPPAAAATAVHELFERRAELAPHTPAVADSSGELTYGELSARANRLAGHLGELGVGPGATVGICMERTTKLLVAVLGVLKAGGAYVPLNQEHPPARLSHQLTETGAAALITEEHLLAGLPDFAGQVVCVDRDSERIATLPNAAPRPACHAEDLAYVMYTSGSTGLPKGVAVTHGNLANYASSIAELIGGQGLRFGVVSAISTDLGNTCIFPPLICGGCVQLISSSASMDSHEMQSELGDRQLDVLKVTPSHLRALLSEEPPGAVLPRRWLLLGGEALSWDLVERVRSLSPECRILNHYGPTETTVGCCAYYVTNARADSRTVPIGRPLPGVRAYVLDQRRELLPPGVPGELCIGGDGVASGYIGRGAETDRAFVDDPFSEGGRMYHTGDQARYLHDGAIEFLGRIDDQVKIRGFRIEPGEIEAALARHPAVRQAAVVPERDDHGELRLVAYIATSADPSAEDLKAFLSQSLPGYMVPSAFSKLDSLPFTPSGKIDRRALSRLREGAVEARRDAEYVAPRDPIEQQIAAVWGELLGIDQVGVFDDFFALGGHSLLATQAIMRIRRLHGNIPLRALLAAPTVADLAEVVRSLGADQM